MIISARVVIGSYFFENVHGEAVTVNSKRYVGMLRDLLGLELPKTCWYKFVDVIPEVGTTYPHLTWTSYGKCSLGK